jgi:hypothetical protein
MTTWPNQINPAAQEFVPSTPAPFTEDGYSDTDSQDEWDFAPPLPEDHVNEKKDTEAYKDKMERWMEFDDDEFCYVSTPSTPPRTNSNEIKRSRSTKLATPVSIQHFPYHSMAPTSSRLTNDQYRGAPNN